MIHERTRSNCKLCSLRDRNRVWSRSPDNGKPFLAIFGEAPGRDEDREREPFIGSSGNVLNWALESNKIRRVNCFVGNVISCRPPDNDIHEAAAAIPLCRGGFFDDLTYLASTPCRTIVALGDTAMKAFKIEGTITKNRGSVFTYKFGATTFTIVPTFHPSYIMRKHWKLDGGGNGDNAAAWLADFRKAKEIAEGAWTELAERFNIHPTLVDVEKFVEDAVAHKRLIAVDTETTSLDTGRAKIVVCGLASSAEDAICIPFLGLHGLPYWHPAEEPIVMSLLKKLFTSVPLLFQNCFYDIPILERYGFEFDLDQVEDTLLLHHTLSPESEHNLGFIVSVYGKTPYWKSEFLNRTTSILEMDQDSMRTYNLRDCVVLHQVYHAMYRDLEELELLEFYNAEPRKLLAPLMEMRNAGMRVDLAAMRSFKSSLEKRKTELSAQLFTVGELPTSINLDSDAELRYFLFGEVPSKFAVLEDFVKSNARYTGFLEAAAQAERDAEANEKLLEQMPPKQQSKLQKRAVNLRKDAAKRREQAERILSGKKYKELARLSSVRDNVHPIYLLKSYRPLTTDSGLTSIDAEGLLSYRIALNNRLRDVRAFVTPDKEEISKISKLLEWLALWHHYSQVDKLLSTYTKYTPDADGRVRPTWKAWGTATGRISSSSPNLMNLPKRKEDEDDPGAAVREFFVSEEENSFVSCDVINLEVYLLAYETLDPDLLRVTSEGANIHDINTKALFGVDETHPKWKMYRAAAKVFQFGRLNYGGSDYGVYKKVMLKVPDMELTGREFAEASARWMALHPAYVAWKEELAAEVSTQRRTRTAFGRLRIFLGNDEGVVREALSTKIQGAGASVVNRSMRRIYEVVKQRGLRAKFVCQVHDQLVMECPDCEVEEVRAIMVEVMQQPFKYKGFTRTVLVDPSVGKTFGEL